MKVSYCVIFFFFMACFYSCIEKEDPDLGEFRDMAFLVDMSLKNRFDSDLLCKEWTRSKVTYEIYVDGICTDSIDVTHEWGDTSFTLYNDNTMTLGGEIGHWLYSHNYLFWSTGNKAQEVVSVDSSTLSLKWEQRLNVSPFFIDNSGEHHFYIFEYACK